MIRLLLYMMITTMLCSCTGAQRNTGSVAEEAAESYQKVTFDTDSAMNFLLMQTAAGPRVPGSGAHAATARFLTDKLASYHPDTLLVQNPQITVPGTDKSVTISNIFARWGAEKPAHILLLAHWDTRPFADNDPDAANHSIPFDGANDGASGVAVLLEVARNLAQRLPDNIGVDLLLTDLEDSGISNDDDSWCLGSQYFADNLPYQPGQFPRYAILLDMVGGKNALFHREAFSDRLAHDVVDHVWAAAAQSGFGDKFVNMYGNPINDDHIPLNRTGIPTIDIIENNNSATGSFNPTWHTMDDNYDNIDPKSINAVGQTILNLIYNE
ncbi:MAG: M28 family peptidase [Muribaculaceae bacterium]|nr:M28 family peptidase [Muribaculaceae bacterium]